jgi:hypothetical protein
MCVRARMRARIFCESVPAAIDTAHTASRTRARTHTHTHTQTLNRRGSQTVKPARAYERARYLTRSTARCERERERERESSRPILAYARWPRPARRTIPPEPPSAPPAPPSVPPRAPARSWHTPTCGVRAVGAALDPLLWTVVPNKALSLLQSGTPIMRRGFRPR